MTTIKGVFAMREIFTGYHLIGILMGTLAFMAIGFVWYSPFLFSNLWRAGVGLSYEECYESKQPIVKASAVAFVLIFVLSWLARWIQSDSWVDGVQLGFLCWLGFVATTHYSGVIWARKKTIVYLIDVGCLLVSMVVGGAIVAAF